MTIDELNRAIRADLQASERREDHAMRSAIFRLRLAELSTHEHLPFYVLDELGEAIQGVVDLIRKQEAPK